MTKDEVLEFAKKTLSCNSVEVASVSWKGYTVYKPVYEGDIPDIGLPHIIIEKNNNLEILTGEEVFDIIDSVFPDET